MTRQLLRSRFCLLLILCTTVASAQENCGFPVSLLRSGFEAGEQQPLVVLPIDGTPLSANIVSPTEGEIVPSDRVQVYGNLTGPANLGVMVNGQLGEETDGIAVGNLDVQEPTFYAGWNNTDYYFNEALSQWLAPTATFPARVIQGIRVCAGVPSKWVYFYNVSSAQPGLGFPLGAASPGVVRLAFMFAKPATATQQYAIRSTPVMLIAPSAPQRSAFTRGQERQASQEIFSTAIPLPAPSYCQLTAPIAGTTFWCFDPIKNRRGQNFGDVAQPLHYVSGTLLTTFPDVDAAPAQQILPGLIVRAGGDNKFNESALTDCPAPPALSPQEQRLTELREAAWSLGVDLDRVRAP
jgi:hypothetical protein